MAVYFDVSKATFYLM